MPIRWVELYESDLRDNEGIPLASIPGWEGSVRYFKLQFRDRKEKWRDVNTVDGRSE